MAMTIYYCPQRTEKTALYGLFFYSKEKMDMKTNADKKVGRIMRNLNRQLQRDCFRDRFSVRMVSKHGYVDIHEIHYYKFEFIDKKCPERNFEVIYDQGDVIWRARLHYEMNKFIVESDFWSTFDRESWYSKHALCSHCDGHMPFTVKREKIIRWTEDGQEIEFYGYEPHCKVCGLPIYIFDDPHEEENLKLAKRLYPNVEKLYRYDISSLKSKMEEN